MSDIKRYSLWYEFLDEDDEGDLVKYEDHIIAVEKLKAEIADLKVKAEEAYDEGYGVGNSVGYCQGLMGED